ncbi:hypothetical protein QQ045_015668 [Rhodiola kirilowii]
MKLTLFVDDKSSKLLFAEADKEFVDFLFTILSLPLATVTRLLKQEDDMLGSLGSLYKGIESLSNSYFQPGLSNKAVLCPSVILPFNDNRVPLMIVDEADRLYRCQYCISKYVKCSETCPNCYRSMSVRVEYHNSSSAGYVKDAVAYVVMDDLEVKPMSSTSSIISLLNTFDNKHVGDIKEKTVSLGKAEALQLLRASLLSKTVLTDVFLSKTQVKEEEVVATSALPFVAP